MPTKQINVTNASFEQTSHDDGDYSEGIPGWTITESGSGEAGDYDPESSEIDLSTVDGQNVAWLYSGSSGGSGVTISQTLSETYMAGRIYTLEVDVGDGDYSISGDQPYVLNILAGSTVIGTVSGNTGDIDALQTVVLQSTVDNPALNGEPITIEIADPPGSGDGEFLVDNVQFFVSDPIDGIVEGTSGDDLIDQTYTDDPEGDVVNDADSPLAGTAPEDDSVQGGGGNDTILTGVGDDTIDAGTGADSVEGAGGDDTIDGGDGGDVLYGDLAGGSIGQDASPLVLDIDNVRPGSDTQNGDNNAQVGDSVIYDNVATLDDGTVVAARLVLTDTTNANLDIDLSGGNGSEILLNRSDDSAMEGEQASFRLEFIDQATGDPLSLNATATFNDIDNASNGIEQVQLNAAFFSAFGTSQTTDISVSQSGGSVTATASDSSNPSDQDHWFSAMFENQSAIEFTLTSRGGGSGYTLSGDLIDDADITPIAPGNDSIMGGAGDDTIFGQAGDDTLFGDAGADVIDGGDGSDSIEGGAGEDQILGGDGNDSVDAGTGNDTIFGGEGADQIQGGAGNDSINAADDTAVPGDGGSGLIGQQIGLWEFNNDDPLDDQAALDNDAQLVGNATPNGNGGIALDGTGDYIRIPHNTDYDLNNATIQVDFNIDALSGTQGIVSRDSEGFDGGGHFTIETRSDGTLDLRWQSDTQNYHITSDPGAITPGTDHTVHVSFDNESGQIEMFLDGGSVGSVNAPVTLDGNAEPWVLGAGQTRSDDATDAGTNEFMDGTINHFQIWQGAYSPDEVGAAQGDTLLGGEGSDTIVGGVHDDLMDGGADEDVFVIEDNAGSDTIIGGEGTTTGLDFDTVDFGAVTSGVDILLSGDEAGTAELGADTIGFSEIEAFELTSQNDTVDGSAADSAPITLDAGGGDDNILAGGGDDTLQGGTGDDTLSGAEGADEIDGGDDADFIYGGAGDVIDGGEGGDDNDTLNLLGSQEPGGSFRITYDADPEDGTVVYRDAAGNITDTLTFSNIENIIACFTPGTLIKTIRGEVDVADLKVGDRVLTRDCGYKPIRWIGSRDLSGMELHHNPALRPVRIAAGALGDGCPERCMLVSPQHRVLIATHRTQLWFGEDEVLVPAVHLVGKEGITRASIEAVTYIHFMFDQHEVVLSDGAWTESFQPGDQTLGGVGNAQRTEILKLFPELATQEGVDAYQSARRSLKQHEAILLID